MIKKKFYRKVKDLRKCVELNDDLPTTNSRNTST